MKKLLSFAGTSLLISALLDPVIHSGLGTPTPWGRDALMAVAGAVCIYLLVKYRRNL
jgi:hypothetical protein